MTCNKKKIHKISPNNTGEKSEKQLFTNKFL